LLSRRREPDHPSLEELPDAIVSVTPDGRVLFWNRSAEQIFGISREKVVGRDLIDAVSLPKRAESSRERLQRAIASPAESYEEVSGAATARSSTRTSRSDPSRKPASRHTR
jgi:PAS domain S-box-containing protein